MSIKIERKANSVIESIQEEIKDMTPSDIQDIDHERLIHELIDCIVPHKFTECAEMLADDIDLGYESDNTVINATSCDNIFTFLQGRIYEEIEIIVLDKICGWFGSDYSEPNYPDDLYDDAQVLASAGWGTDEDYGTYSVSDEF